MQEGIDLHDHVDKLNLILLDMRNIDVKVDDEDATLIMLASISGTYNQALELLVSGVKGHGNIRTSKDKKSFPRVAEDETKSDDDISLAVHGHTHSSDVWVVDTGETYHMKPRRKWFSEYTEVLDIKIKTTNDFVCKIAGIGSIKLMTLDGRSAEYSLLRVFISYGDGIKGLRVWSPSENRVVLSRNIVFDKASMVRSSWSSSKAQKGSTDKQVELQDDHEVIDPVGASGSKRHLARWGIWSERTSRTLRYLVRKDIWPVGESVKHQTIKRRLVCLSSTSGPKGHMRQRERWYIWRREAHMVHLALEGASSTSGTSMIGRIKPGEDLLICLESECCI
uniref:Reverse transcriptase Ty1/copia-type domain-containing protein n=1 Tax=Brassica oleracea var. oleracea TaxID=109376 RepID=A0A0D3ASY0_BRAOL